jgi:hypothetical protein
VTRHEAIRQYLEALAFAAQETSRDLAAIAHAFGRNRVGSADDGG